ncbi:MAG: hypothetical protein HOB40_11085 [Candidatus Marinimicrobia bacterium]|jgi:hypothetical protein|nr:hypothetical protein [Candidatus Neomarinimicrobiota bacterium]MBT3501721.1 hypothetical protein [Candidatus Neomarinimicrobiota bacterium]MBT3839694.1 hypothetical protein [Candidatus Neomarinimicrobiota bacterium]MBT3999106.1 hypothetical protein [Candidatus Neomarinimicrobiota bacterium]MBT4282319.1 hypothetical protein [Candidatus Neomarinimicrobiota bacterium]
MIIRIAKVLAGGILGFLYYKFIGCNQGCGITGSPINSTLYGAMMGVILAWPTKQNRSVK